MTNEKIFLEESQEVATLTLNRPEKGRNRYRLRNDGGPGGKVGLSSL